MKNNFAKLTCLIFKEGNKYIAYSPSLDLSTCGDTIKQAKAHFQEAVDIFLKEVKEMGTLENVLLECGWEKKLKPQIKFTPPKYIEQYQQQIAIPV